jgi:uncharacterized protein (DUF1697 family)
MASYVAMLRGINVGGRNRVGMDELRAFFTGLGYSKVTTFIQSGNVVFETARTKTAALVDEIQSGLPSVLGVEVAVLVRSASELRRITSANPFLPGAPDSTKLHVTFLTAKPAADRVAAVETFDAGGDELSVAGQDVYLHCPGGYGRTKLSNAFLERQLAVGATTRAWKTVNALFELTGG